MRHLWCHSLTEHAAPPPPFSSAPEDNVYSPGHEWRYEDGNVCLGVVLSRRQTDRSKVCENMLNQQTPPALAPQTNNNNNKTCCFQWTELFAWITQPNWTAGPFWCYFCPVFTSVRASIVVCHGSVAALVRASIVVCHGSVTTLERASIVVHHGSVTALVRASIVVCHGSAPILLRASIVVLAL